MVTLLVPYLVDMHWEVEEDLLELDDPLDSLAFEHLVMSYVNLNDENIERFFLRIYPLEMILPLRPASIAPGPIKDPPLGPT